MSAVERACCPDGTVCTASKVDHDLESKVDGFTLSAQYDLCVDKMGGMGCVGVIQCPRRKLPWVKTDSPGQERTVSLPGTHAGHDGVPIQDGD